MRRFVLKHLEIVAAMLLILASASRAADKDTIVWKPVDNAILQVDSRSPKIWNIFQPGKKLDPLLVQVGNRYMVFYIQNMIAYELKPEQLQHKGDDLVWRESDKPAKPMPTSNWSTKDVGSATRVLVTLADEGRLLDIQIPKMPDVRRGIY